MSDQQYDVLVASEDDDFCDCITTTGSQTISQFKASLSRHANCHFQPHEMKLTLGENNVLLRDDRLMKEYGINEESFISMSRSSSANINASGDNDFKEDESSVASSQEVDKEIQIYTAFLSNNTPGCLLTVDHNTTVEGLKALIMSKYPEYTAELQRIFLNGTNLKDDDTLRHYNIDDGHNLFVMLKDSEPDLIPDVPGRMLLYVSYEGSIHTIYTDKNATTKELKALVWEKTNVIPAYQRLNFNGEDLASPAQRLSDCLGVGITAESLIYLFRRREGEHEPGYSLEMTPGMNPDLSMIQNGGNPEDTMTIYLMNTADDSDVGMPHTVKKDAPLREMFHEYASRRGMSRAGLEFHYEDYGDLTPDCELSAEALGIENGKTIMVVSPPSMPVMPQSVSHEIDLTFTGEGTAITLILGLGLGSNSGDVTARIIKDTTSLGLLFGMFAEKQGVEGNELLYLHNGKYYSDKSDKTAAECGMEDGDVITVLRRSRVEQKARAAIAKFIKSRVRLRRSQRIVAEERRARKVVDDFVWSYITSKRRQKLKDSATRVQKVIRGYEARKIHGQEVETILSEFRRFTSVWKPAVKLAAELASASPQSLSGWAFVRDGFNMKKTEEFDEDGNLAETDEKLNKALAGALAESHNDSEDDTTDEEVDSDEDDKPENNKMMGTNNEIPKIDWSQFQVTHHVCRFLKRGDKAYREIFVKKMKQLAKGERSHKLQKPLQGCQSVIYETYLENKSGWRILWTEEGAQLVIWFVTQHKNVSRLSKLIDDAKNRAARQQIPASLISEMENGDASSQEEKMQVKLDPIGNVPLKLYDIDDVDEIIDESWTPQMHLTQEERNVVEAKGTILLLGRSGTGKTVCICNRMECDRNRLGKRDGFSQLFVSRSSQLCRYVKDAVGDDPRTSFTTFDKLIHQIESSLSEFMNQSFPKRRHVDYFGFKNKFYTPCYSQDSISALIVWKAIRTFLKGSIEAYKETDKILPRKDFINYTTLGKNRCKVPLHLRERIYEIFVKYQQWKIDKNLWDDCDRIAALLKGIEDAKRSRSPVYDEKIKRTRLYVDEVQDYSQIEILLFFYCGGPGALFLAGDPAQSVVEGIDFRFEDIRSVGYYVAGDKRHLIPEKPRVVNINFRSHQGVLNLASCFLDLIFNHFPGSAKHLPKDHGLFNGSRPGVFQNIEIKQLATLLEEKMTGAVVLTHDDSASLWRERLRSRLVYGIREAKGMEFKSVIILDFFKELPSSLQKPWRDLLLNRVEEGDGFQDQFPLVEMQLKLIYCAVTRSIEQLFFAETTSSICGEAAVRWLTTTSTGKDRAPKKEALATFNDVNDIDAMSMSCDEFCIVGIDNAELAETSVDTSLEASLTYLDRAIYCFEKAQKAELVRKARVHSTSLKLRDQLINAAHASPTDKEYIEKEASDTISLLLKEHLFTESSNLLDAIVTLVSPYTKQKLDGSIASSIDSILNTL